MTGVGTAVRTPTAAGVVGPNAILQTVASLRAHSGDTLAVLALQLATGRTLATLPEHPVDEREAAALMRTVRARCGDDADEVLRDAGRRTGDYLLRNRIPRAVQQLLRLLPAAASSWLLWRAASRHAWTFAGSGRFSYQVHWSLRTGTFVELRVADSPLCRSYRAPVPQCAYYAGAFERLQRAVVGDRFRVREVECATSGGEGCRFVASVAEGALRLPRDRPRHHT